MKNTILTTLAIALIVLAGLTVIRLLNISYPVQVTTTSKAAELAVVGEGKVEVVPDIAYLDAGVAVNNAKTVGEAQSTITKVNNDLIEAMKQFGIKKEDIKTSNYSVYPNYSYQDNVSRIDGYNGNATITVKIRNTAQVPTVIESATNAGANQINGVRFSVEKPEKYREQARLKAIENAREQAQKLAKSLGIPLGKVVNVVESTPTTANYYGKSEAAMGLGGGGAPDIEAGSQTITSIITLYFEKK